VPANKSDNITTAEERLAFIDYQVRMLREELLATKRRDETIKRLQVQQAICDAFFETSLEPEVNS
jgi:hypothetical protein